MPKPKQPPQYFRFWHLQWRSSRRVQKLSWAERGLYQELLIECFENDGITSDLDALAHELALDDEDERAMLGKVVGLFFVPHADRDGFLMNEKINDEICNVLKISKEQSERVQKRWNTERNHAIPKDTDAPETIPKDTTVYHGIPNDTETYQSVPKDTYKIRQDKTERREDLNQEQNKTAGALFVASPSADAPPSELVQKKKKVEFDAEQLALAEAMADDLKKINPNLAPNLEKWANDIRLLEQARKTSIEAIESLWKFANTHSFWQKVILSPSNLREKWDRLETERLSAKAGHARAAPVNKIAPIVPHYQRQEGFIKL